MFLAESMTETPTKAKGGRAKYIAVGVIVALIGAMMIVWVSGFASGGALSKVAKVGHTEILSQGAFSVSAHEVNAGQFSVPNGATDVKVTGRFIASGGSGNDIIVIIMSDTDYINWRNGHSASTYYNSGKVTADDIDVTLPAGKSYYLVFDNTFSVISTKNVSANIELNYYT
jgi:hypothetical protein